MARMAHSTHITAYSVLTIYLILIESVQCGLVICRNHPAALTEVITYDDDYETPEMHYTSITLLGYCTPIYAGQRRILRCIVYNAIGLYYRT